MSTSRICHDSMIFPVYTVRRYFVTGFLDVLLTFGSCQVVIVRSENDCDFKEAPNESPAGLRGISLMEKNIFEVSFQKVGPHPPKFQIQRQFSYATFRFTSSVWNVSTHWILFLSNVVKGLVYSSKCRAHLQTIRRSKGCWAVLIRWQPKDSWKKQSQRCSGDPAEKMLPLYVEVGIWKV